jgi:hypothetical protein
MPFDAKCRFRLTRRALVIFCRDELLSLRCEKMPWHGGRVGEKEFCQDLHTDPISPISRMARKRLWIVFRGGESPHIPRTRNHHLTTPAVA